MAADIIQSNPKTMAAPGGHYSHAVSANGFVFVSGQLPISPDGAKLNDAPFERQAQQVLDNVAAALTAAGSAVSRLVRLHLRPIQYEREAFSDKAVRRLIVDSGELRGALLDLARADTTASAYPTLAELDELEERMNRLDEGGAVSAMRDPLTGDQLMVLAGRGPGPWVGRVKSAIRDAVVDGTIEPGDSEGARAWLDAHHELLSGD